MTEVLKEGEIVNKPPEPTVDDLLEGAIKVYEKRGWHRGGWSNGDNVCILESVNVARFGRKKGSWNTVPKEVIERIHRAIFPDANRKGWDTGALASEVMRWNDMGKARDKEHVVSILKKALKLGKDTK